MNGEGPSPTTTTSPFRGMVISAALISAVATSVATFFITTTKVSERVEVLREDVRSIESQASSLHSLAIEIAGIAKDYSYLSKEFVEIRGELMQIKKAGTPYLAERTTSLRDSLRQLERKVSYIEITRLPTLNTRIDLLFDMLNKKSDQRSTKPRK